MSDAYFFGKTAALQDLVDAFNHDASFTIGDAINTVQYTLQASHGEMNKMASVEDLDVQLGIEAVCYDLLKEASAYHAMYDVIDDRLAFSDILDTVIEKHAEEEAKAEAASGRADRFKAWSGQKYDNAKRHVAEFIPGTEARKGLKDRNFENFTQGGKMTLGDKAKLHAPRAAGIVAGLGAAAGAAYGGKKLYDRYKAKQEEENNPRKKR